MVTSMIFFVAHEKILEAMDEAGEFVQSKLDKLNGSEESRELVYESIIPTIVNITLKLVAGASVAKRSAQNSAADELPPIQPPDLYGMASREISAFLQHQKIRSKQKATNEKIEMIDQQFRVL